MAETASTDSGGYEMIEQSSAEKASEYLRDQAAAFGKAKAERVYLEEFRKTKKALLFQQAPQGTIPDREAFAYGHPEYLQVLEGLKQAVEAEETLRWKMIAAQVRVDVWRTQEASTRRG
jgi:hypothetical protein